MTVRREMIIGIALSVAIALIFRATDFDLRLQRLAYNTSEPHWPYAMAQPWKSLHDFGTLPGLLLALVAVGVLALSFRREEWLGWQNPALYIIIYLAIGPGLVTNLLGKILAGRPRADEVLEFGGVLPFHRPFDLGLPGRGYSFLCGHCSMGFLFFALFFVLSGWRRWVALTFSTIYGLALGVARVVQGAHFASDVLLDGSIMFVVAASLTPLLKRKPTLIVNADPRKVAAITVAAMVVITIAFLFSTPIRKEETYAWVEPGQRLEHRYHQTALRWSRPSMVLLNVERGDIEIAFRQEGEPLVVESLVRGFGFPGADVETEAARSPDSGAVSYRQRLAGLYWEAHSTSSVIVTAQLHSVRASTGRGRIIVDSAATRRFLRVVPSTSNVQFTKQWQRRGNHFEVLGVGPPLAIVAHGEEVILR